MDLAEAVRIAFIIALAATGFAVGLGSARADLAYLWRHPALLFRTLLATVVLAPLVAVFLWRALPIGAPAAIAIIAGALAPGLPFVPRRIQKIGGNVAFASSAMLTTSLLGVITIPIWLAILRRYAGIEVAVPSLAIARLLGMGLLVPLLAGVAIRRLAPRLARRIAGPVSGLADALLPGLALVVLVAGAEALLELGWAALVAMVVAPVVAIVLGHLLGGPRPRDRTVLAIANASRFPALAVLIASTSFPDVRALPAVIAYAVIANVVTVPYALARRRTPGEHAAPAGPAEAPPLERATPA